MTPVKQYTPVRVLLADDDVDDRMFFERALKELSIESHLTMVYDGEQLMKHFSKHSEDLPDILFLDLSMPRKTGFECLSEIKEDEKLKDISIIVYSTFYKHDLNYEQDMKSIVIELGAHDFVKKPGDFEQLKHIIQKALTMVLEKKTLMTFIEVEDDDSNYEEDAVKKSQVAIKKYVKVVEELNAHKENLLESLTMEKKRSDDLLLNILPSGVAEELKQNGTSEPKLYNNVSVLFTDFVDFTMLSETLTPKELVSELHHCFSAFDTIIERNGLEKIKTIGDAYLAVCGLPNLDVDHAKKTVQAAIEILDFVNKRVKDGGKFNIRIGINSGTLVAGIVGVKKFAYDIWGDTVNIAARMEQHSSNGKINISDATYLLVKDDFTCTHRGKIEAKNKGKIDMYYVESLNGKA